MTFNAGQRCENCRCAYTAPHDYRRTVAEIQNRVFRHVRRKLAPSDGTSHAFHFAVLDGYQNEIASRGYDWTQIDTAAAGRYVEAVRTVVGEMTRAGLNLDVIEILRRVAPGGILPEDLLKGAESYSSTEGQPLAEQPSRLEQCLAIRTAMHDGLTDLPEYIQPFPGVFVVEDYLGPCDQMVSNYRRALRILDPDGVDPATRHSEGPICTPDTAPHLVAEHLDLFRAQRSKSFREWLDDLPHKRPGFVFLPFSVLGQYRACGVWMFQESIKSKENVPLVEHLKMIAPSAEGWLSAISSHAVLQVTNILLLKSLTQFKDVSGTPLSVCRLAQQALASLWYSTKAVLSPVPVAEGKPEVRKVSGMHKEIAIALGKNMARLLAYQSARYTCLYVPTSAELEAELRNAAEVFGDISEAAAAVSHLTKARASEIMNKLAAVTAHEHMNGLADLMLIADVNAGTTMQEAAVRLEVVNSLAEGLLGHPWVARNFAKTRDGLLDTRATELRFRDGGPQSADLRFWRDFARREAICIAFAALARGRRERGERQGPLSIRYRFAGETADGPWKDNADCEEIEIDLGALQNCLIKKHRRKFIAWPIPPEAQMEQLLDEGQRSMMMLGARELMRNAARKTASIVSQDPDKGTVTIVVEIKRDNGFWLIRFEVTNPWIELTPPPGVFDMTTWPDHIRTVLDNAQFRDGTQKPGEVSYIYELEVRKWHREI